MTHTVSPAAIAPAGPDEDAARADIYGLLAHLFYAPPAPGLLAQLRDAPAAAPGSMLEASWNALSACARDLGAPAVQAEHEALFGGVGKPEIYLFGSHYLAGFLNEKPLVRLRDDLAALDDQARALLADVPDRSSLDVASLTGLPAALRTRVLRGWLGGTLTAEHIGSVDALITRWHGQGPIDLPGGRSVARVSGKLVV